MEIHLSVHVGVCVVEPLRCSKAGERLAGLAELEAAGCEADEGVGIAAVEAEGTVKRLLGLCGGERDGRGKGEFVTANEWA